MAEQEITLQQFTSSRNFKSVIESAASDSKLMAKILEQFPELATKEVLDKLPVPTNTKDNFRAAAEKINVLHNLDADGIAEKWPKLSKAERTEVTLYNLKNGNEANLTAIDTQIQVTSNGRSTLASELDPLSNSTNLDSKSLKIEREDIQIVGSNIAINEKKLGVSEFQEKLDGYKIPGRAGAVADNLSEANISEQQPARQETVEPRVEASSTQKPEPQAPQVTSAENSVLETTQPKIKSSEPATSPKEAFDRMKTEALEKLDEEYKNLSPEQQGRRKTEFMTKNHMIGAMKFDEQKMPVENFSMSAKDIEKSADGIVSAVNVDYKEIASSKRAGDTASVLGAAQRNGNTAHNATTTTANYLIDHGTIDGKPIAGNHAATNSIIAGADTAGAYQNQQAAKSTVAVTPTRKPEPNPEHYGKPQGYNTGTIDNEGKYNRPSGKNGLIDKTTKLAGHAAVGMSVAEKVAEAVQAFRSGNTEAGMEKLVELAGTIGIDKVMDTVIPALKKGGVEVAETIIEQVAKHGAGKVASAALKASGITETGVGVLVEIGVQAVIASPEILKNSISAIASSSDALNVFGIQDAKNEGKQAQAQLKYTLYSIADNILMGTSFASDYAREYNTNEAKLAKEEKRDPHLVKDTMYEQAQAEKKERDDRREHNTVVQAQTFDERTAQQNVELAKYGRPGSSKEDNKEEQKKENSKPIVNPAQMASDSTSVAKPNQYIADNFHRTQEDVKKRAEDYRNDPSLKEKERREHMPTKEEKAADEKAKMEEVKRKLKAEHNPFSGTVMHHDATTHINNGQSMQFKPSFATPAAPQNQKAHQEPEANNKPKSGGRGH